MKRSNNFIVRVFFASIMVFLLSGYGSAIATTLSDYFVSTDYVAANKTTILLIDLRSTTDYGNGHIKGAINVQPSTFYFERVEGDDSTSSVLFMIPTANEFIQLVDSWGVKPSTTVVVYGYDGASDGSGFGFSNRLTWTLRYYGHQEVYVMNGGFEKWQTEDKRPVTTTATLPKANKIPYAITAYADNIRATKYDVLAVVNGTFKVPTGTTVLLDCRTSTEYQGTDTSTIDPRLGHIPGAIELTWPGDVMTTDSKGILVLKPEAELETFFAGLGLKTNDTIITYCEGGFRSAHVAEILLGLGYKHVMNYEGSWNEWSNSDPTTYPMNTGSTP